MRHCRYCRTSFVRSKYGRFCSSACKYAVRKRVPCTDCGSPTGYAATDHRVTDNPVCLSCRRRRNAENAPPAVEVWTCAECGEDWERPRTKGQRPLYCSDGCRNAARWRARSSDDPFVVVPKVRTSIYERDGWLCQLCYEPLDLSADYLTPKAPTLDHIIPRSLGGSDDPSNLQSAHRGCNSSRQTMPLDEWYERRTRMDLVTAAQTGRVELLTALRDQIARQIQDGVAARDMASLSKRLVDISIELEALAAEKEGDDIDEAVATPDIAFTPAGGAQTRSA